MATTFPRAAMVGDVNAFLTVPDEPLAAEVDVMVPERASRRAAARRVRLLLPPARRSHYQTYVAKIASKNAPRRRAAPRPSGSSASSSSAWRPSTRLN